MELTIETLRGRIQIRDLDGALTVEEFKRLLYEQHGPGKLQIPDPEHQRLVYNQQVLADESSLEQEGLKSGESLVVLSMPELPSLPEALTTPAPDLATIKAAIYDEARKRGIVSTLKEEAPRRAMRVSGDDFNRQIMELLEQALGLNRAAADGAQAGASSTRDALAEAAAALAQAQRTFTQANAGGGQAAAQAGAAPQAPEQEEDIQVPDPPAEQVQQLTEMGFSEALARKATILCRGNVELALEWVLAHMDDADAEDPPTQEQLRQVYGRRRRRGAADPAPGPQAAAAVVEQLVEMGFEDAAASSALRQFGSMEAALAFLLAGAPAAAAAAPAPAAAEAAGDARAAAAAGAADGWDAGGAREGEPAAAAGEASSSGRSTHQMNERERGQEDAAAAAVTTSAVAEADREGSGLEAGSGDGGGAGSSAAARQDAAAVQTEESEEEASEEDEDEDEGYDDEYEEEDEDEEDEYEDTEEDEGVGPLPMRFGDALGSMGSMDLSDMNSSDMEQLLQGANLDELYGHQLLLPGALGAGAAGIGMPQDTLLRIVDVAQLLQQAFGQASEEEGDEEQAAAAAGASAGSGEAAAGNLQQEASQGQEGSGQGGGQQQSSE